MQRRRQCSIRHFRYGEKRCWYLYLKALIKGRFPSVLRLASPRPEVASCRTELPFSFCALLQLQARVGDVWYHVGSPAASRASRHCSGLLLHWSENCSVVCFWITKGTLCCSALSDGVGFSVRVEFSSPREQICSAGAIKRPGVTGGECWSILREGFSCSGIWSCVPWTQEQSACFVNPEKSQIR